jgi:hypothetical protein
MSHASNPQVVQNAGPGMTQATDLTKFDDSSFSHLPQGEPDILLA